MHVRYLFLGVAVGLAIKAAPDNPVLAIIIILLSVISGLDFEYHSDRIKELEGEIVRLKSK